MAKGPWRTRTAESAPPARAEPPGDPSAPGAAPEPELPPAFWPTVALALTLHIGLLAGAIALTYWSAYHAGLFAVLGGVGLMLWGPARFRGTAMLMAGIGAAMGAAFAGLGFDRARELRAGELVRDISVAAAPLHPHATGFVFVDARLLVSALGSYRHVDHKVPSSGRSSVRVTDFVVAPLVAQAWKAGDPVPAWVACDGGNEAHCERVFARARPVAAVTVPRDSREYHIHAIDDAIRRHRLGTVPGAPILLLADDPDTAAWFQWARVWLVQPLVFMLWFIVFVGWRAWRRSKTPAKLA